VARRNSNQAGGAEHLLAALLSQSDSWVPSVLQKAGIPTAGLSAAVATGN